ncbi:3-dehydroquinate synthase [Fontisphaera persica]|uniref:3-dehydroquinate synthase n=1 Tax=Fontisphaera persica TaxID=2974023 RepID=UPI0024C04686|nr:3-dehydroquinate synthase [Fontisphaera persica]WCJ60038.1 3-dehydroquinate synthase [Fontisphaera persica]
MHDVEVPLGNRSYHILVGVGNLSGLGEECRRLPLKGPRCAIITDDNVRPLYGPLAEKSLKDAGFEPLIISLPAGESTKSLKWVDFCYQQLAAFRLERQSFLVALGGGVIGDLAGFVAATYLRGIPFVQVPTTLLAQVDSSVGGKVGINLEAGKNLVGAFYQPRLVICDLSTLTTLPLRELRAGLAEVIKYGAIYDADLFQLLEATLPVLLQLDLQHWEPLVARCCAIKAEVVAQDETESGLRAILNFGHTIGHAIEAVSGYGHYLHGEAIAIGMVAEAWLSQQNTGLSPAEARRLAKLIAAAGLPVRYAVDEERWQKLLHAMQLDKKVSQGQIKFVLLSALGRALWGQPVAPEQIRQSLASTFADEAAST